MGATRILCKVHVLKTAISAALVVYLLLSLSELGVRRRAGGESPRVVQPGEARRLAAAGPFEESLVVAGQRPLKSPAIRGQLKPSAASRNGKSWGPLGNRFVPMRAWARRTDPTVHRARAGDGDKEEDDIFRPVVSLQDPAKLPPTLDLADLPYRRDDHYRPSKCPKTIASMTKYSRWFGERFQPDVKMFLEGDDISNGTNYYNLLHYRLPFGYRFSNRTKLSTILNHPNYTSPSLYSHGERPERCTTCAVVGSGGILNGSSAGQEIDNHEYVFRLNRARSRGRHSKDVGNKTTFYTFFPESMHIEDLRDEDVTFFYMVFKAYDLDYAINFLSNQTPPSYTSRGKPFRLHKPQLRGRKLKIIHPDFFRYAFTRFLDGRAVRPTTGAMVVFLALHLCDEVTIYGFGYDPRFTLHYYDKKFRSHSDVTTSLHDVDNERRLWEKLHDEGVLRLFKRDA